MSYRYFNPANYYEGGSYEDIWDNMGEDIYCNVNNDLTGKDYSQNQLFRLTLQQKEHMWSKDTVFGRSLRVLGEDVLVINVIKETKSASFPPLYIYISVSLVLPAGFDTTKPIKMVTHGFSSSATGRGCQWWYLSL